MVIYPKAERKASMPPAALIKPKGQMKPSVFLVRTTLHFAGGDCIDSVESIHSSLRGAVSAMQQRAECLVSVNQEAGRAIEVVAAHPTNFVGVFLVDPKSECSQHDSVYITEHKIED